jgi:RNA polymerase sigma-70 factor, ECF subfamily
MSTRDEDLELAAACARGDSAAIARFEAEHFGQVDAAYARFRNVSITRDELRQAMRDRIFVATQGPPRIASYLGRGDLGAWVRMVATRYLVDVVRAESARPDRAGGDERVAEAATADHDPELAFLKRQYREEFRAAFRDAMAALDPRDRNILRHRYLDSLEVAELATIYGVHRVSMSRTLARIREELLASIRREFLRRLGIGTKELDSIMGLVASQLELSLSRLLR